MAKKKPDIDDSTPADYEPLTLAMLEDPGPVWAPVERYARETGASGGQRRVRHNGKSREVPHLHYEYWMDRGGNICTLPVAPNRLDGKNPDHRQHGADAGPYRAQITLRKFQAGMLPLEYSPEVLGWVGRYSRAEGVRDAAGYRQFLLAEGNHRRRVAAIDKRRFDRPDDVQRAVNASTEGLAAVLREMMVTRPTAA